MARKTNGLAGSRMAVTKLTEDDVLQLRHWYDEGLKTPREIGIIHDLSTETVRRIVRRESFQWVMNAEERKAYERIKAAELTTARTEEAGRALADMQARHAQRRAQDPAFKLEDDRRIAEALAAQAEMLKQYVTQPNSIRDDNYMEPPTSFIGKET